MVEVGSENGIDFNTGASKEELGVVEEIVLSKVGQLRQKCRVGFGDDGLNLR